jgi:CcmD family protein
MVVREDITVMLVALVVWGLLFVYLLRLERRVKELEKR